MAGRRKNNPLAHRLLPAPTSSARQKTPPLPGDDMRDATEAADAHAERSSAQKHILDELKDRHDELANVFKVMRTTRDDDYLVTCSARAEFLAQRIIGLNAALRASLSDDQ